MKLFKLFLLPLFVGLFSFTACSDDDNGITPPESQDIVQYLQGNSDFSILVDAVVKADLASTLSGDGPFTVFAPSNLAFQTFLDAAGTGSVDNTPVDILIAVLTNHVIGQRLMSTDLTTGYFTNLSSTKYGPNFSKYINIESGVRINGNVNVVTADIDQDNGVIHVVDQVIDLPNIVTFALADQTFSTLVSALTRTDLTIDFVEVLTGDGPFTVFAPTNDAFQALLDSNPDWSSLNDIPVETLEAVLLYHVTGAGNVRSTDLSDGQNVATLLDGSSFTIDLSGQTPAITAGSNTAKIIATDVQGSNGVVHVIDTVILP